MSYTNESLRSKLDALQETQESIVSTSTWVLFHYRFADRIAAEWEKYLYNAPPNRKLAVIYLANDVVQQARARKRVEFLDAFFKVLPGSLANAFKKVPPPVQQRIIKIINVLTERKIFNAPLVVPGVVGGPGASAGPQGEDEKLRALASSGQKFHKFYHELLLSANGKFGDSQLPYLLKLRDILKENIGQMKDLEVTVEKEIGTTEERVKEAKEKLEELKKKQAELEEQRRLEHIKQMEEEKKRQEEESMMPTYQASSDDDSSDDDKSDSDSDSDSDDDKKSDNEEKEEEDSESKKRDSSAVDDEYDPSEETESIKAKSVTAEPESGSDSQDFSLKSALSDGMPKKKKLRFA